MMMMFTFHFAASAKNAAQSIVLLCCQVRLDCFVVVNTDEKYEFIFLRGKCVTSSGGKKCQVNFWGFRTFTGN